MSFGCGNDIPLWAAHMCQVLNEESLMTATAMSMRERGEGSDKGTTRHSPIIHTPLIHIHLILPPPLPSPHTHQYPWYPSLVTVC